jgi:hypothetical protein
LLPTKINKKLANIKLEKLKTFLFAFSNCIPIVILQRPRHIKIKGKKASGSDLFIIRFIEIKGKTMARIKLLIKYSFFIKYVYHLLLKLCIMVNYIQAIKILFRKKGENS